MKAYVNGIKVGEMKNKYGELRNYTIPAGILKAGKNIITVRVEDTGGGGGIYGDASDMKITIGNKVISLSGEWSFKIAICIFKYNRHRAQQLSNFTF